MYGNAVVHQVKVVTAKVNDPLAARILHAGVTNIPFPRHSPVKDLGAAGHFVHFKRNLFFQPGQSLAETVAGDAAANRVKLPYQRVELPANRREVERGPELGEICRL